ncbi:MAG: right-handed parallel beta-helix repeat-containing protein [Phycisphaerae bacterium]|nr:right-handed parallel beta-helix repeat-containing protein [Phycisphaerae bacterium]
MERNLPLRMLRLGRLMLVCLACTAAAEHAFYVSPTGSDTASGASPDKAFATITRARDAIRELKKQGPLDGDVTVHIRGGMYDITEPIRFGPEDSGTEDAPIKYVGLKSEVPRFNGGRRIAGWQRYKDDIWVADVPDVRSGKWRFRQLYVNGEKRRRARTPNEGFLRVAGFPDGDLKVGYHTDCQRFEFAPGDIDPTWRNLDDVEVIVYHFWTDSHLPIKEIDAEKNIVTFKHKAGKVFTDDFTSGGARYIVENVFESLDQPGEWYLDRKKGVVYYIPMPGEDLKTAEIIAPVTPAFIELKGDPVTRKFVEHIRFMGLSFAYTNWHLPPGNSNDQQGSASVPAAITLTGARNCVFVVCTVKNTGTFAFELREGCQDNLFASNMLTHLGAGGFRVNGGTQKDHPLHRTGRNEIVDNRIGPYGEEYPSAVGVLLMHTDGNRVTRNEIHHGWYTGVSIGWQWGYQRSVARDNVVEGNHIHHIGQGLLSDMGAIYTLGVSPGTVIRNNLIHDVDANHYGGWGIYNDEGSSGILIEKNIVYNTKFAGYNIHFAKEITVRNNIFALGRLQQLSRSRVEPHQSVFFENNIVYWTEGELLDKNWRDTPYTFYFHPKDSKGTREVSNTFDMDWNLYFNPNLSLDQVKFNGLSFEEWKKLGKDKHSVYGDPGFVDVENHNFMLKPDSPALELGFEPIDAKMIGPLR